MGTKGLGTVETRDFMRVPRPAASTIALRVGLIVPSVLGMCYVFFGESAQAAKEIGGEKGPAFVFNDDLVQQVECWQHILNIASFLLDLGQVSETTYRL